MLSGNLSKFTHTHTRAHARTHARTHTYTLTETHTKKHTTHMRTHTHTHTQTHTHTHTTHTHAHTHTHTHTHTHARTHTHTQTHTCKLSAYALQCRLHGLQSGILSLQLVDAPNSTNKMLIRWEKGASLCVKIMWLAYLRCTQAVKAVEALPPLTKKKEDPLGGY